MATDGYLDFMFVDKDTQGQGVASTLLSEIERKAIEQNNDLIYSDVSLTAKGFFENKGFIVERQQLKKSKKKELINFRMIKKGITHGNTRYSQLLLGFANPVFQTIFINNSNK